jgi:hypothetical protein
VKFKLEFDCDNAAFEDLEGELRWVLSNVTNDVSLPSASDGTVRDSNGNRIGEWRFTEDEDA